MDGVEEHEVPWDNQEEQDPGWLGVHPCRAERQKRGWQQLERVRGGQDTVHILMYKPLPPTTLLMPSLDHTDIGSTCRSSPAALSSTETTCQGLCAPCWSTLILADTPLSCSLPPTTSALPWCNRFSQFMVWSSTNSQPNRENQVERQQTQSWVLLMLKYFQCWRWKNCWFSARLWSIHPSVHRWWH